MEGAVNKLDVTADEAGVVAGDDKLAAERAAAAVAAADDDDDAEPTGCGGLGVYPGPLQRLASRHVFIIFFCLKNVFQSMVLTYLIGVQTSVERHFHFSSQQTGLLPSVGELGPLLSSVFLSYLASHGNRPRWMGIGMAMVTFGLISGFVSYLLVASPEIRDNTAASRRLCVQQELQLLGGGQQELGPAGQQRLGYSAAANSTEGCTIDASGSNVAFLLWSVMYILVASGSQTIFVVSAPYMDDGISQKNSPLFFALAGTARILGPIMGYMLASTCISVYVDPSIDPGITKRDQRWIGAWWIGLLVIAAVVALYGWLISLFPRQLSTQHLSEAEQEQQRAAAKLASVRPSRQEFVSRILRLLRNPILMASSFSLMFFLVALLGFFSYQPKYLEHQFRVNKATSTTYAAISKVTLVFGTLGSGILMRKFRPSGRLVSGAVVVIRTIATAVFLCNLVVSCGLGDDLPGVPGPNGLEISSGCSAACGCTTEEYIPVCHRFGEESRSYFSPCHAGCTTASNHTDGQTTYTDCRCLDEVGATLTSGLCQGSCDGVFGMFLAIVAISGMISSSVSVPHFIITLRCVRHEDKAMALGLSGVFVAVAFGLGPMIAGSLVDDACLVWEESCGQTGACWVYDPDTFRHSIVWFYCGFYMLSVLCDVVIFFNSKTLNLYPDEEEGKAEVKEEASANGVELTQKQIPGNV